MIRPRTPFLVSLIAAVIGALGVAATKAIFDVTVQDYWKEAAAPFLREHLGSWSTTMLEWIGPFWAGAGSAFALMFAVEMAFAWFRKRAKPPKSSDNFDFEAGTYHGLTIRVSDLIEDALRSNNFGSLNNKSFVNCKFVGPACMFFNGQTAFGGRLQIDTTGTPIAVMAGDAITGVLTITNCAVLDCSFENVQFLVNEGKAYNAFCQFADSVLPPRKIAFQPV